MSEIIRETGNRELSHIVKTDTGSYFYVDSNDTYDCGFETMVFMYDEKKHEVAGWGELYVEHYDTYESMKNNHYAICNRLELFI